MSINIKWKSNVILNCNNTMIEMIRLSIEDIIMDNDIRLNKNFDELMLALDRAGSGFGFDLADYLHTKKDLLMFIDLVRQGIDRYNQDIPGSPQSTRDSMEGFYQELIGIAESFPG